MTARRFRFAVAVGLVPSAEILFDTARHIEQRGYSAMVVADGLWLPAPFPILSAVAAVTSTLRVGTAVLAAPLRAPAAVAQQAETLDLVSAHRFELGVGTGQPGVAGDADQLGRPFGTRQERLAQVAATLTAVQERFAAAERTPPRTMLAGVGRKLVQLAAERADALALPAPFDHTEEQFGAKVDELRQHVGSGWDALELAATALAVGEKEPPEWVPPHFRVPADSYAWLRGTPAQIADALQRRRDRTGVSYVTVPQWHADDFAPVVDQLAGR